jgi:hypothetical protein
MWLKVLPESDSGVSLSWGDGDEGPYPVTYTIGRATLLDVAKKSRDILDQLANWAKDKDEDRLCELLHSLAYEGSRLRFLIFDCPAQAEAVAQIEQWVVDRFSAGDKALTITSDPSLHVPWGLVYDGDPDALTGRARSITDYEQFWSLKFTLSLKFSAYEPLSRSRSLNESRLLSVINSNVFARTKTDLPEVQFQELWNVLNKPVGIAFNLERCNELINEAASKNTLFHFFGHGNEGVLDLGAESIDVVRFKMMMTKLLERGTQRSNRTYNVVFLNACDTAAGQLDANFRYAASQPGLCGFVATEAPVPRKFAAEYGYRFLKAMVIEGKSIASTMSELRHDPALWPLSLLYSCYGLGNFRLVSNGARPGADL